jgi:hypothetical protein
MTVRAVGRLSVVTDATAMIATQVGVAAGMGVGIIGQTARVSMGNPGPPDPVGGRLSSPQSGSLEGVRGHEVSFHAH